MTSSTLPEVKAPDTTGLVSHDLIAAVSRLDVTDQDSHTRMGELLLDLSKMRRRVTDVFAPPKRQADGVKKFLLDMEKTFLTPIQNAESLGQDKNRRYRDEENRKAEEQRKRLEEEARQAEADRQLADAIAADESGDKATAEAILDEKPWIPVVEVRPQVQVAAGMTERTTWSAVGRDLAATIAQIAGVKVLARPDLLNLVAYNQTALNALARAQRENMAVDGVDAKKDTKEVPTGR